METNQAQENMKCDCATRTEEAEFHCECGQPICEFCGLLNVNGIATCQFYINIEQGENHVNQFNTRKQANSDS